MSASFVSRIAIAALAVSALGFGGRCVRSGPLGGARCGQGEKEPAAKRQEVRRARGQAGPGQLRDLSRREGQGDGAAAVALNPKPADWTSKRVQDESDGELFWKISNGRGAMPPWKHLPEQDRWALIRYIRSLK